MNITINYKNGEFTCIFTPDEDSSLPVTVTNAIKLDIDDTVLGDQEPDSGLEASPESGEMIISDQDEHGTGGEEDVGEFKVDVSPVLPAPEIHVIGRGIIYGVNGKVVG